MSEKIFQSTTNEITKNTNSISLIPFHKGVTNRPLMYPCKLYFNVAKRKKQQSYFFFSLKQA